VLVGKSSIGSTNAAFIVCAGTFQFPGRIAIVAFSLSFLGSIACRQSPPVPHSNSGEISVKSEDLYFALNATTHALRFAEAAAQQFTADPDDLESGSKTATSVAFIKNQLSDAQRSLGEAQGEIGRLIQEIV
jgi:hypothetical protein